MNQTEPTVPPVWIVMPILGARQYTITAIADCLAQSVPVKILLINQGVDDDFRDELERIAEEYEDRILLWSHQPPLPSLSATWNRALDFVWEVGGTEALVVNNDCRFSPRTLEQLRAARTTYRALFVSAVGVTAEQFVYDPPVEMDFSQHGGPDFSCFLISRECHMVFRFDENHIPCYCEDLTFHRDVMLAGYGADIFSVNVPYLHYASGTLKSMDSPARQALEQRITQGSRAYFLRAWGGVVNQERYAVKGDPTSARDGVTTPELQHGGEVHDAACIATEG